MQHLDSLSLFLINIYCYAVINMLCEEWKKESCLTFTPVTLTNLCVIGGWSVWYETLHSCGLPLAARCGDNIMWNPPYTGTNHITPYNTMICFLHHPHKAFALLLHGAVSLWHTVRTRPSAWVWLERPTDLWRNLFPITVCMKHLLFSWALGELLATARPPTTPFCLQAPH